MIRWETDKKLWRYGLPKCHHRQAVAVLVIREGRRGIREQCADCGKLDTAPLKLAEHPDAPPADDDRAAQWQALRDQAGAAAQVEAQRRYSMRQAAKPVEAAEWWEGYDAYLGSDRWQAVRRAVLKRDNGTCQAMLPCCTRVATEAHHKRYDLHRVIGNQPVFDIVAVCHECHAEITRGERLVRKS